MTSKFLPIFLLLNFTLWSQSADINLITAQKSFDYPYTNAHYVLVDNAIVRECSNTSCKKITTLSIGEKIKLLDQSEKADTINGIISHWYKIKIGSKTGWISGALIAQNAFGSLSDPTVKFVFGLKEINRENGWPQRVYQLRAFRNNLEIDQKTFKIPSSYIRKISTIGNAGLELEDVIVIDIPCEGGCGCATGKLILFWNGQTFSTVENLLGTADAWASESKAFIFPVDMEGIPNTIIKVSSYYIEEINETLIKRGVRKVFLRWNGHKLVKDSTRAIKDVQYTTSK